jgi:hypothetical protein
MSDDIEEDFKNLSFIEKEEHSACDLEESIKSCYLAINSEFYNTNELNKNKLYKSKTKTNIFQKSSKFNIKKNNSKKETSKLNNKTIVKKQNNLNLDEKKKFKSNNDLTNIQKKTISFKNKEKPQIIQKSKTSKLNNNINKNLNKNSNKNSNKNILSNSHNFNSKTNQKLFQKKPLEKTLKKKENSIKKYEDMKKQIFSIFEENNNLLKTLPIQLKKNDEDFSKILSEAQNTYEKEIEELYNNQIKLLNEVDNKYNKDIFELKNLLEEENYKSSKEKESDIKALYLALQNDKENEINNINKLIDDKKNEIMKKYKETIDCNDFSIEHRSVIIKNELFDNFINKIHEALYPNKTKKKEKEKIENNDDIIEINNDELLV